MMQRIIASFLLICVILSFVAVLTGSGQDFHFKDYINGMSDAPKIPEVPSAPDFSGTFWEKTSDALRFIGRCLWYPFQFIAYISNVVVFFFRGLSI